MYELNDHLGSGSETRTQVARLVIFTDSFGFFDRNTKSMMFGLV